MRRKEQSYSTPKVNLWSASGPGRFIPGKIAVHFITRQGSKIRETRGCQESPRGSAYIATLMAVPRHNDRYMSIQPYGVIGVTSALRQQIIRM